MKTTSERISRHVDKHGHRMPGMKRRCWEWTASKDKKGYGKFGVYVDGRMKMRQAHRVMYELYRGPIPLGLKLDHLCRNRSCVRPSHLDPVTTLENNRRSYREVVKARRQRMRPTCPRGHRYTGVNVKGNRLCHVCARESTRKWRETHGL